MQGGIIEGRVDSEGPDEITVLNLITALCGKVFQNNQKLENVFVKHYAPNCIH